MDTEILRVAVSNIYHQKVRARLTILGIIIGIAAIVALLSIGATLQNAVNAQFALLGKDTVYIAPSQELGAASVFSRLSEKDVRLIEQTNGVDEFLAFYETAAVASRGNESKGLFLIGVDPTKWEILEKIGYAKIEQGRALTGNDEFELVVPKRFLTDAFDKDVKLRERLEMNNKSYRIVGTLADTETGMSSLGIVAYAFLPAKTVQNEFNEKDVTEGIATITTGQDPAIVAKQIENRFEREFNEKRINASTNEGLMEQAGSVLGAVQVFLAAIAALSLLVGGLGIANTTLMNVLERYQEIGTMKALGASSNRILSIFLAEAILMSALGGLIGSALGLIISALVSIMAANAGFGLPMQWNFGMIGLAIGFAMLVGMIAGFLPAKKAADLDPVVALRYE